jgi:hypothetical protein
VTALRTAAAFVGCPWKQPDAAVVSPNLKRARKSASGGDRSSGGDDERDATNGATSVDVAEKCNGPKRSRQEATSAEAPTKAGFGCVVC